MVNFGLQAPLASARVLLIEDDAAVAEALCRGIERSGMQVQWAKDGASAMSIKIAMRPDVVLVDLELPDVAGVTLIRWLVDQCDCGVIVVSGASDDADRIVGLELGADDYVGKPPHIRELVARIRAVHRRTARGPQMEAPEQADRSAPGLRIDLTVRSVFGQDGRRIALTSAEFTALELLFVSRGRVVARDKLSQAALHKPWRAEDRSVDQLILGLRQKLGPDNDGETRIESVRGSGYLLRPTS